MTEITVSNEWKNAHYFVPTLSMFIADFGDPTVLYAKPKYGEYDGKRMTRPWFFCDMQCLSKV